MLQDYSYTTIWNVIGTIRGSTQPEELVIAGNHRDAWVYGAADPSSGTAAMLETVHGIGELLKVRLASPAHHRLRQLGRRGAGTDRLDRIRRAVCRSLLESAAAYFNMDVGVAGPDFGASSVPSLKQFLRDVARGCPVRRAAASTTPGGFRAKLPACIARAPTQVRLPSAAATPIMAMCTSAISAAARITRPFSSTLAYPPRISAPTAPYGVYHSVFDNFAWFTKFADPTFVYEQQMARVFGLEVLRMAQADALPFDYETYGSEAHKYLENAQRRAQELGWKASWILQPRSRQPTIWPPPDEPCIRPLGARAASDCGA